MKKKKQLLALLGVLVVLIAVYLCAVLINNNLAQKAQAESEAQEQANRIILTDMDAVSIAYENGTDNLAFYKEDDVWYYQEDKEFPLAQSYLTNLESLSEKLDAVRALEDGDTLAAYGLENPKYSITVTDANAAQIQLFIGNATNEQYYCKLADSDTVYTIEADLVNALKYGLNDMLQLDTLPVITSSNLETLAVTNEQESYLLKKVVTPKEVEVPATDDSEAYTATSEEITWVLVSGGEEQAVQNTALVDEMLTALQSFAFVNCVDYKGTENAELMQQSGLDTPRYSFTATYTDTATEQQEEVTVYGGEITQDSNLYAKLAGSKAVNLLSAESFFAVAKVPMEGLLTSAS